MKRIGLIGGLSWVSTEKYYRIINQGVYEKSQGKHFSAKIIICSVDFKEVFSGSEFNWKRTEALMLESVKTLELTQVDIILICSNTMHSVANIIEKNCQTKLLHIADATATEIKRQKLKKIAFLGTKPTMEKDFYISKLVDEYGLEVIVPELQDRNFIHHIIETELVQSQSQINRASKQRYINIINGLIQKGAEGVILGCTEIGLLIQQQDIAIPVFDTTELHAQAAVDFALS